LNYVRLENKFVMISSEVSSNDTRESRLIEVRIVKSDGECFHRPRTGASHQSYDHRRIRSTAQQSTQRDIRKQADANRFLQHMLHFLQTSFFACRFIRSELG